MTVLAENKTAVELSLDDIIEQCQNGDTTHIKRGRSLFWHKMAAVMRIDHRFRSNIKSFDEVVEDIFRRHERGAEFRTEFEALGSMLR